MRKPEFKLEAAATSSASRESLERAQRVLEMNMPIFQLSGVVGSWVGAQASNAYIMLALNRGTGAELKRSIPDAIDGISIYFIEGAPVLQR